MWLNAVLSALFSADEAVWRMAFTFLSQEAMTPMVVAKRER
jgi:hypothetical protein